MTRSTTLSGAAMPTAGGTMHSRSPLQGSLSESHRTDRWPLRWYLAVALVLVQYAQAMAQQISNDPSDATATLTFNSTAGLSNALTAACTSGSLNPSAGDFSLALAPVAPATSSTAGGYPPCGNFYDLPPSVPSPAPDAWFRIDPPAAPHRFRITLVSGTLTNGGMAVYEALSAAGPFRLLECATGGSSITGAANQPTLDAVCYSPGHKLYVRVWDENARANNLSFRLCVQGQDEATLPARGAAETPCAASPITASATFTNVDYVFACNETPWLFADSGQYVGGDLWMRLTVPPTGAVGLFVARGTAAYAATIGVTAYTASDCADPSTYRQVGNFSGTLPSITPTVANLPITCLPPGSTLYVRIHSVRSAQSATLRYGRIRIRWTTGPGTGTPPANNQPCGATPLTFNGSCPVATTPMNSNIDACNTGGIPAPSCGGFDGNSRDVWYSFVAPPTGTVHIETSPYGVSVPANPAVALYTAGGNGCNGRLALIECDDRQGAGNGAAIIRTGLVPGETYYVRVWAEGSAAAGQFTVCISEPVPPAGHCFYVVDLWAQGPPDPTTYQGVQYQIDADPPVTLQTPTGGEASQLFLIPVPSGSQLTLQYFNQNVGNYIRTLYQLGDTTHQWYYHGGIPVYGPQPTPVIQYTVNVACAPIPNYTNDCLGTETVCAPNTEYGNLVSSTPPGNTIDLSGANMGCLSAEGTGITWLIFRATADGTVAFWFDAPISPSTTDLDFAIWDAGPVVYTPSLPNISGAICAPDGPPVRCSSARRNHSTGLLSGLVGVYEEGTGGTGWLSPLPVLQDHVYLIALVRASGSQANVPYQMRWTQYTNASGVPTPGLLGCTPMILPVELLFLEATPSDDAVMLHWATGSERNSALFVVERSADGSAFQPIGQVAAAGFSNNRTDYHFEDSDPLRGTNYYRLRQVDQDGAEALSNVVVALFDRGASVLLFPNPTTGDLFLSLPPSDEERAMEVRITDVMGRLVFATSLDTDAAPALLIPTGDLPSGTYLLHLTSANGPLESTRFVKQ